MKRIMLAFVLAITVLVGASMPALAVEEAPVVAAPAAPAPYSDIMGTWFEKSALAYAYTDIFSNDTGCFNPDAEITRMEFARLMHKALNIKVAYLAATDIAEYYSDVKNTDVGANQLYDLVTLGIIDLKDTFGPDSSLLREDMIHFLINAVNYKTEGKYPLAKLRPEPFADEKDITPAREEDVIKAILLGLIKGSDNNMLLPKAGATRAEGVTVADRLVSLIARLTRKVEVTATYSDGKDGSLELALTLVNKTGSDVTITHPTSQKFDFKIFGEEGKLLYTWSDDKFFSTEISTTEIQDGETVEYPITLNAKELTALKGKIVEVRAYIPCTAADFIVAEDGYTAGIK